MVVVGVAGEVGVEVVGVVGLVEISFELLIREWDQRDRAVGPLQRRPLMLVVVAAVNRWTGYDDHHV